MKAVVAAFNQEKALVGAFSVITNLRMELFQALHISCILESTPCGELCTVTAPRSCPVFTCDYLFCFWMCLIEVFVLFMSIIPSKLLSYLLPTLTINTLSIVQSAAKSEHNAAWEVLAAVLQCCRVLSGQVEVGEWKQVFRSRINIFPHSPFSLQLKTIILCTESLTPSTLQGEMEFWILWILNSWICKTIVTKLGSTFRVK